ncbi:MAG: hypothetical protein JXB14_04475 [Candidatus Altiarchaeota archaeon]|nr:hypothetical protein [Candidatus Altiarchaeota archaeon]
MAETRTRKRGYAALKPVSEREQEKRRESRLQITKQKPTFNTSHYIISALLFFIIYIYLSTYLNFSQGTSFGIALLFLGLALFVFGSLVFLEQFERAVVQRFGKFNRVAGPGWTFILPALEKYNVVDVRIKTLDLYGYEVITKDKIRMYLDIVVYAKVVDPYKAVLLVRDINLAVLNFLTSIVRETAGNMTAEEVISNVARVNELLAGERDRLKKEWGVDLISVEIQEIRLPESVQESMHELRSAEYQRQVIEQQAYAREAMINAIQRAATKLDSPALSYLYLEALKKVADGKSTKIIFPMELTRLAESVSQHFGVDKDKFLQDILKAYRETVAKDMPK